MNCYGSSGFTILVHIVCWLVIQSMKSSIDEEFLLSFKTEEQLLDNLLVTLSLFSSQWLNWVLKINCYGSSGFNIIVCQLVIRNLDISVDEEY